MTFHRFLSALALVSLALPGWAGGVRDFGAAGDGETDDTEAIVRAIEETKDGLIEFPRGDYRITRTIEIRLSETGRTGLSGRKGAGRVVMAGPGPAFRFIGTHRGTAGPGTFEKGVWERERMPQIDGLEIVGAHPGADGVEFDGVMQPTVRGVLIRETRHGVRLVNRNRNLLIDASHIYNCAGAGVFFDRVNLHQANIQGSHISYCKGGGIKIVGSEIRNLQITGNDIEYNYDTAAAESADLWIDVTEGSVREGAIAGNTIQARNSPGGANIRFIGHPNTPDNAGVWSITGNHISNQEVNIHLRGVRGVTLTGNTVFRGMDQAVLIENSRHVVLTGNALDRNPNYYRRAETAAGGISIRGSEGVILTGLLVDGARLGGAESGGAIEIIDSREVSVIGCQVLHPQFRGIYVSGSRNVRLSENTILDRSGEGLSVAAIEATGDSKAVIVRGNLVGKGRAGAILAEPGVVLENNHPAEP